MKLLKRKVHNKNLNKRNLKVISRLNKKAKSKKQPMRVSQIRTLTKCLKISIGQNQGELQKKYKK